MELRELRDKLSAEVASTEKKLAGVPHWRLAVYGIIAFFVLIYLAWCHFSKENAPINRFIPAPPAAPVAKTEKVAVPIQAKTIKVIPKETVKKKLPDVAETLADDEEVGDTAEVPAAPNGAETVTIINKDSGEMHTEVKVLPAPWFAFEKTNYLGAGAEVGTEGQRAMVYYKRDILRIKNLHFQVKPIEVKVPLDGGKVEVSAGAYLEYRQ